MGNQFGSASVPLMPGQQLIEMLREVLKSEGKEEHINSVGFSIDEVTVISIKGRAANLKVEYQYGE